MTTEMYTLIPTGYVCSDHPDGTDPLGACLTCSPCTEADEGKRFCANSGCQDCVDARQIIAENLAAAAHDPFGGETGPAVDPPAGDTAQEAHDGHDPVPVPADPSPDTPAAGQPGPSAPADAGAGVTPPIQKPSTRRVSFDEPPTQSRRVDFDTEPIARILRFIPEVDQIYHLALLEMPVRVSIHQVHAYEHLMRRQCGMPGRCIYCEHIGVWESVPGHEKNLPPTVSEPEYRYLMPVIHYGEDGPLTMIWDTSADMVVLFKAAQTAAKAAGHTNDNLVGLDLTYAPGDNRYRVNAKTRLSPGGDRRWRDEYEFDWPALLAQCPPEDALVNMAGDVYADVQAQADVERAAEERAALRDKLSRQPADAGADA